MKKIFGYGKKNEKGITLTALVITVVVLSAIAAVGLKAADSEIKSVNEIQNEAQKQEDKIENTGKQINKMYDDLDIKDVDLTAEIKQTTCSFEISNVQLQNSSEIIGRYKYFIKEKDSSSYRELSNTKDNFMTMDKLRHNTQYDIKIEVYNQSGKRIKTSVKTAKTNELTAGSLILKLKDNAGAEYTPGTWTASDVYVRQVEGNAGKTTYQTVGSSAQTIAQGTSGEIIVSKSGVTTIRVITTDGTNKVNGKDYVIKIDKEAPISGALKMQLDNSNGAEYKNDTWTNHDIYVSLQQGNSNLSGIKSTIYNVTGAETHTNQTQPLTLKTTGTYTINVITTNNVGTTSTKTYTVKIDKDAPEAGKLIMKLGDNKGNDYADGTWTNQNVYIAKQDGTDALSGHKSTVYNVTGKSNISNTQDAITLTETGEYTLTVITTDNAENTSTRIYKVKIDKVNPTTPEVTNPSNGEWTKGQVKITIKSTDANSGIDRIEWFENGAWTTRQLTTTNGVGTITYTVDRNTVIRFRAVDKAGNISDEATTTIKLDTSAPDKQAPEATSTPSTIKLTFKQTDNLSGINGSTIRYAIYKDGKWSAWQTSDTFTGLIHNAEYKVKTQVSDNVGNTSESNETTISTKKLEAGTLKLNLINASGNSYVSGQWTKSNVYVSLSQAQYGTSNYESISGSAQTVATGTTADSLITKAGITTLRVKTIDGPNTVYSQNYIVKVDNQKPTAGTLTMKLNSSTGSTYTSGNWTNQNVWIHKNDGSDNLSGHQSTTYNVSGAETLNNQTADNTLQTEGTYTLTVKTLDKVSNSSTRGYTVKIDKTAPTDAAPTATATTNSITATFKQTDSLSGINNSSIQYAIKDGNSWSAWQTSKTFTGLKTNQTYIIKTKATDNAGNTQESKELSIKTTELKAGTLTLTKETATGSAYTSGQWSNKNVYVKLVQSSTGTSTYSSTSNSAQLVSAGTKVDTTVSTNGTTTLKVTTTDGNNTTYSQEYVIKVDKELPTTISPTVSSTTNTITVTCNQTDSLSGINASSKKYAIYKNGAWSAWQTSNKFTNLTHNTEYKVKTQITDNAGNTSESVEATAKTTTLTAGTLTLRKESSTGSIYQSGTWSNKSIYVTLTKSSIGTTTYESVTGSAQTVAATDSATTISADGTTTLRVKTTDGINTVYSQDYVIKIDTVAPTAGKMALKLDNGSGGDYTENTWTNHSVYAALTNGSDILSGHKSTTYSITGGATVSNATAATTLNDTNTYTIKVTTIDNAGNSATRTQIVKIDKEAPTAPEITNPSNGAWTNGNVTITAKSTDAHSGIDKIEWYENGAWTTRALTTTDGTGVITYTADRNETIRFRAVDKAGNASSESTTVVKIDKTSPSDTAPTVVSTTNTITVTSKQTDSLSGIKSGTIQYAIMKGTTWSAWQTSNQFTGLTHNTEYKVKTKVTDNAGNTKESLTTTISTKELQAGSLTLTIGTSSGSAYSEGTWTKSDVYVTLNKASTGTTTYESLADSAQTVVAGTASNVKINTTGTTTLKVKTTDGKNTVYSKEYVIKIDKVVPTAGTLTMKKGSNTGATYSNNTWTNQSVYIEKINGTDKESGHKSTVYSVTGKTTLNNQTGSNTLTDEGTYTAKVTTTDNALNSSTRSYTIKIDKTAPTNTAPTVTVTTKSITVTNKQTDALSGIASTQYALKTGSTWSAWQTSNVFNNLTTNKTYSVKTKTTDNAGNSSESAELSVTTNNLTAGSLTLKHTDANGDAYTVNTWTKDSIYVALTKGSAGTTTYESILGSAQTVAAGTTATTTVNTNGTTTLRVKTTDGTNTVYSQEYIIKIDKETPTNAAPTVNATTNSLTVTNKQIDNLSGIASVQYAIYKGNSWSAWQTSNQFTGLTHNTTYKVKTKTTDKVGNASESAENTTAKTSNLVAGTLTLTHNTASGSAYTSNTWTKDSVYVALAKASTGTTTYESITGSAQSVGSGTTADTTVNTNGTTTLRVKTTDGTNTVYSSNYVIKVDKVKPTAGTLTMKLGSSTGNAYTSNSWTNQSVWIHKNDGSDTLSGHKSTTYTVSGANLTNQTADNTISTEGTYTVTVTTYDNVDNSSTNSYNVKIDKTAPTTTAPTATSTTNGITVTFKQTDSLSGINASTKQYAIYKNGAWSAWQTSNEFTGLTYNTSYKVKTKVSDNAGNSSESTELSISTKNLTAPTLSFKLENNSGSDYTVGSWVGKNVYVTLNKAASGTSTYESLQGSAQTVAAGTTAAATISTSGTTTLRAKVTDGTNTIYSNNYVVKVDKNAPTNVAPTASTTTNSISVASKQTDNLSGLNSSTLQYAIYKGSSWSAWQTSNAFTGLTHNTAYKVKTKVSDNVGNTSESKELSISTKQLTAGGLTLKHTNSSGADYTSNTWTKDNVFVTLKAGSAGTTTYESITGSAQTVAVGTTADTTVNTNGTTTLRVKTTDGTNTVYSSNYIIKKDTQKPTAGTLTMKLGSSTGSTYTSGAWTNQSVWLHKNDGSDTLSGHKSTTYTVTGASLTNQTADNTISTEGKYTATVTTYDNVSNSSTRNYTINIDKTAPTTIAPTVTQTTNSVTIANKQTDALSGIASVQYALYNGSSWSSWQTTNTFTGLTTNKVYKVKTKTKDKAGNSSESAETSVTTTTLTAGTLTMKLGNSSGSTYTSGAWTNQNVYVTLNKATTGTTTYESVTGSAQTIASGTTAASTVSTEGTTTLKVKTTDGTNTVYSSEYVIKVDKTAPDTTAPTISKTTKSITVTCKQSDSLSGINASTKQYAIYKNGTWSAWQTSNVFNGLAAGKEYQVKTKVSDNAGNSAESAATKVTTTTLTAGTLTMKLGSSTGNNYTSGTWTNQKVYVSLNNGSAGTTTYESISGSAQTVAAGTTAATTISSEGTTTLRVTTTDGTNTVYSQNYVIKIDTVAPTAGKMTLKLDNNSGADYTENTWTNHSVYAALTNGSDALSGHKSTTYSITGGATVSNATAATTLEGTNTYTIKVTTVDNAGNSATRTQIVKIDKEVPTAPTITNPSNGAWKNANIIITAKSTDAHSGINRIEWYENGAWTTRALTTTNGTGVITYTADRNETIRFRAVDNVGNASTESTATVKIDKTAPTKDAPTATSTAQSITVKCKQADVLSGINSSKTQYALKTGDTWSAWQTSNTFTKLTQSTSYVVKTKVTDNAGNSTESNETTISTAKLAAGTLTLKLTNSSGNAYTSGSWTKTNVYVKLNAASVGTTTYASESGSAQTVASTTNDTTITTTGTTTLKVTTTDGTNTSTNTYTIKIDKVAPTAGTLTMKLGSSTGTAYTSGNWTNKNVWIHKNDGSDGQSGHKSTTYTISAASLTNQTTDNTLTDEGKYTAVVTTTDNVSNSSTKNYNINIDKTAPTTVAPTASQTTNSITVTNKQTDSLSGVSSTQYAIYNGSSWSNWQSSNVFSGLTANKAYKVKTKSTDKAGNSSESAALSITTSNLTAGSLTLKHTNASGAAYTANTWTKDSVYVTLNSGSSGTTTYASVSGSAQTVAATSSATTISISGTTTLVVTTTDGSNTVKSGEYIIKVDKNAPTNTAPTISATTNSVTVTCKQTDNLSGINASTKQYAIYKDGAWSAWQTSNVFTGLKHNTTYKVKTKVSDNVGNTSESAENTAAKTSNLVAGTLTLTHNTASGSAYTANTWTKDSVYVALVKAATGTTTYESISGSAQTIAANTTNASTISTTGTTTLRVKTTDGTNTVYSSNYIIKIDKAKPTAGTLTMKLGSSTGNAYTSGNWTNQNVWLHKNDGSDNQSGHKSTTYTVSGANLTNQTADNTISAEGKYTATVTTYDNVDNSNTNTYNINIDKTAPTNVAPTASSTTNSVTVTFAQTDSLSGINASTKQYAIYKDGTWSAWQTSNTFTGLKHNTAYTVKTKVSDNAGNSAESNTTAISTKNLAAASLTFKVGNNDYTLNSWTSSNVSVTLNKAASGTSTYESISGSAQTIAVGTTATTTISTSGTTTLRAKVTDGTNTIYSNNYVVKVDKNAPTTTAPTVASTTNSITVTCKQTDNLSGINASTTQYAIYKGSSWSAWQTSNTFTGLTHNTAYKVKTKISDNVGNTSESTELSISTKQLTAGGLTLKHTNSSGSAYTANTWTKDNVYVTLNKAASGTSTYESVSGSAQTVAVGTTADTTINTNGTTTLRVKTTDGTNTVYSSNYIIKKDAQKPTAGTLTMKLRSSTGSAYTSGAWTNQNVWLHKNDGSDTLSGHKSTTYTVTAASLTNQTADNTISAEGKYTAVVTTYDNVSNSSTRNYTINIDKTAPTTVAPTASTTTNSITVSNKQTDALSGIASVQYALYNGSSWSSWQSSNTFTGLTTNKVYKVKTKTTDKAGNSSESIEASATTTNLTVGTLTMKLGSSSGSTYTSGAWTNQNVYVTLNKATTGTTTYLSTDSSVQAVAETASATTINKEGTSILKVKTTDGTNTAYSSEYTIKIDKTAPTTAAPTASKTTKSITVTCNQTDGLSGINASTKQYAIYKDGAWSAWQKSNVFNSLTAGKEYQVKTKVSDNAGNSAESTATKVTTTTLTAGTLNLKLINSTGANYTAGTWTNQNVYVTLNNGSAGSTTYSSVSGSAQSVASTTGATTITTAGTTTLKVTTTDGTNSASNTYVIKIDKTAPTAGTLTMKLNSSAGAAYTENTWTANSVYVHLNNGSDETNGSGHKSTSYSITGPTTASGTNDVTLTTTGTYTVKITTTDNAGNSATRTVTIKIDKENPATPTITNAKNNTWTNDNVTVTIKSSDNHSGIDRIEWYENNAWTTRALTTTNGTGTISYTVNRNETVRFRAVDKVGNVSAEATTIVKIDKTAPTNTAPTATVTAQSIIVTCKQTDSLSGIKSGTTQYALKTGTTWSAWQTSNTFTKLKQSTSYVVKTKVTDNAGNSAESSETTVSTSKLTAGTLTLKHTNASGAAYTSNTWTKDNVYVTLNKGSAGTTTYASESGSAQTVAVGTTAATTITTAGTTTLKVTTTDGTNTSTNTYTIKIDKTAPTAGTLTMKLGSSTGTTYTSGAWTNQNVWVHKNDGSDSQSGHKSTTYTISAASLTNQTADNTLTKEGKYTAVVTTTDNVSNSSTKNYNINIDKTAPTTVAPTASQTTNSITVTNKQTDALSGVSSTQYAIYNGSSWSSWQSSNVFSGLTTNKTYKVKTKTTDKAGNSSESAELSVTTSNLKAGSLTLKHTNASGAAYTANTWTKDSVYVTLNNGSAGTTTYASVSGSAQTVAATSSATTITTSGTTTLVVTTTDGTNTVKSGEYIIKVDKNAPTTAAPKTSVTTNSVTVTCKQTDSLSGINASTTQYAIYKGSSWSAWQTSNKFTGLTHNTSYKVKTKISDNVGNSGESAETTVSTSKLTAGNLTLKHTNASGAAYTSGSWSTTNIYVALTSASTGTTTYESISGSAQTVATGTTTATTITTAGTTTLRVKTTDGTNTVYSSNYVIKIDKTKPTAGTMTMKLGSSSGSTYTSGTWTNQSVYIALKNGSDETGGSGHSSTTYSISGAATQSNQTAAQTLTAAGKYTITITTKDVAGNSSTRTQYVYIDKTKPTAGTLTMKLDSSTGSSYTNNTWTNHSVYISLNNGSDETNGSGHSSTTYSISGSATQSNQTAAQTLSATGTYNITVTTKDKTGNTSTNNYVIKIDKTAPNVGTLTMKLDSASGENYTNDTWTNHNIYIAVNNGNDANSGHQSTTYSISGPITVSNSSEARTLTEEGTYTVVLTTKDMAGNTATRTYTIKVDKTPPIVSFDTNGCDSIALGQEIKTLIHINDELSGNNIQYGRWMQSLEETTFPILTQLSDFTGAGSWNAINNSYSGSVSADLLGYWKLWIYAEDVAGNYSIIHSNDFKTEKNNLDWWSFKNPNTFNRSYNAADGMNTINFCGINGYEIIYIPLKTIPGQKYYFRCAFQNLSTYTTGLYSGIMLQVLNNVTDGFNNENKIVENSYFPKTAGSEQYNGVEFTATQSITYIAFNFSTVDDWQNISLKLGKFILTTR